MADSWLTQLSVIPTAFAGGDSKWGIEYRKLTIPLSPIFHILYPAPLCGAYRAVGMGANAQEIEDGIWEIGTGFEFPCVRGNSFRRGASDTNGRGQVRGGQPGTPIKPPV